MAFSTIAASIAAELQAMARTTESLGETLCSDPDVAQRCLPLLQQFDLLAQQQAELARLIAQLGQGSDAQQALGSMRLEALADRLGRAA